MLQPLVATHFRVLCNGCSYASAEVCCRRDTGQEAAKIAIERLRQGGWHVDGLGTVREKWYSAESTVMRSRGPRAG
jgi:hypothetical protein